MEKIKPTLLSMAPFVHSRHGISGLWYDMIAGMLPVFIASILVDIEKGLYAVVLISSFALIGTIIIRLQKGSIRLMYMFPKYVLWSMMLTVILPSGCSLITVIIAASGAQIAEYFMVGASGATVFPAFAIAWLIIATIGNSGTISYNIANIFPVLFGGLFMLFRRRISVYILAGYVCIFAAGIFLGGELTSTKTVLMALTGLVFSCYPGIIPGGNRARILFGMLAGTMIWIFGIWGYILTCALSPLMDLL
ncbi:MAG: hypothetical protein ABIH89_03965 [Elusimicrobiota bacterium]